MNIEQLVLTKEEIPILHGRCFELPIHPALLREKLNPLLAHHVFPQAAKEWYDDFSEAVKRETDPQNKRWYEEVFLVHPEITIENGHQVLISLLHGVWRDMVLTEENGFASSLSINRDVGGTIGYQRDISVHNYICPPYVNFTPEKLRAYAAQPPSEGLRGVRAHSYNLHNVDHLPGALFLRNWGLLYLNAAMCSIKDKLEKM